jgi:hypothetical protein
MVELEESLGENWFHKVTPVFLIKAVAILVLVFGFLRFEAPLVPC